MKQGSLKEIYLVVKEHKCKEIEMYHWMCRSEFSLYGDNGSSILVWPLWR
jgi:hypothetical protein